MPETKQIRIIHPVEPIAANARVSVTRMQQITEVQYCRRRNTCATIRRLNKAKYLVLSTGEVKFYTRNDSRAQNLASLKASFKRLRRLINNNFSGASDELFITLTYAEDVTDPKQISHDFDCFMKRLRRRYPDCEYIKIAEPQGRLKSGRAVWHYHLLLKGVTVLTPTQLTQLWPHGYTKTKALHNVDDIGRYLTSYLTDIPLTELSHVDHFEGNPPIVTKHVGNQAKAIVKRGRLQYYPSGMNFYTSSRGIKAPTSTLMAYNEIKRDPHLGKRTSAREVVIESANFHNKIITEEYNANRH